MNQLDNLLQEKYQKCWLYSGKMPSSNYVPSIKVEYDVRGSLLGPPSLVNPSQDAGERKIAESALKAVRNCTMDIPTKYSQFYNQWKSKTIRFDNRELE